MSEDAAPHCGRGWGRAEAQVRGGDGALRDTRAAGPGLGGTWGAGQGGCKGQAGGMGCTGGVLGGEICGAQVEFCGGAGDGR